MSSNDPAPGSRKEPARLPVSADDITPKAAKRKSTSTLFIVYGLGLLILVAAFGWYVHTNNRTLDHRAAARDKQRQADIARIGGDEKKTEAALATAKTALAKANATSLSLKAAACYIVSRPAPPNQTAQQAAQSAQFASLVGCPRRTP